MQLLTILFVLLCATHIVCNQMIVNLKKFDGMLTDESCDRLVGYIHQNNFVCVNPDNTESSVLPQLNFTKTFDLIDDFYEKNEETIDNLYNLFNSSVTRFTSAMEYICPYFFSPALDQLREFISSYKTDLINIIESAIIDVYEPIDNFFATNMETEIAYKNMTFHFIPKNMIISNCSSYYEEIKELSCISLNKNFLLDKIR
jgi:hypothetical protein